jgi:hypothetical protein
VTKAALIAMLEPMPEDVELLVRDHPMLNSWSEAVVVAEMDAHGGRVYFYPPGAAPAPDIE